MFAKDHGTILFYELFVFSLAFSRVSLYQGLIDIEVQVCFVLSLKSFRSYRLTDFRDIFSINEFRSFSTI